MAKTMKIGKRLIGDGEKCFIIGEIGSNHGRSRKIVRELIDAAAQAKFDAVKFQIYDPQEAFSKNVMTKDVHLEHLYGKEQWWKICRDRILMPREWFKEMFAYARKKGLIVFSAVHWAPDIKFLLDLGSQVFKIASIDCNHLPLLKEVAKAGKPMIISTGMARLDEIDETVKFLKKAGNDDIALLHCVSCYPPKPETVNLRNITLFKKRYPYPVGFSDHSVSNNMSVAAVALGATIIEKHLTLDRRMHGPDHPFALEPEDMKGLVRSVREVEAGLGSEKRVLSKDELASRKMIRRSLVARVNIRKGEKLTEAAVKYSRPSGGICPNDFEGKVKGHKAARDIPAETIITWDMVK